MEPSLQVKTQLLWSVNSLKGWKCHLGDRIWTVRASCLGQNCVKVLNLIFEGENLCAAYKKFLKYSLKLPENHYFIPELNQFHLNYYFLLTADCLLITRSICQILAFEKKCFFFCAPYFSPRKQKLHFCWWTRLNPPWKPFKTITVWIEAAGVTVPPEAAAGPWCNAAISASVCGSLSVRPLNQLGRASPPTERPPRPRLVGYKLTSGGRRDWAVGVQWRHAGARGQM